MARPVILGNGSLTVGLDEKGLVHDFYYPYVGMENLNNARSMHHLIGVWIDGDFSWVDSADWQNYVSFESDALISRIALRNEKLGVELNLQDFVDNEFNAFCRQVIVKNNFNDKREIRLFMHQVFEISSEGRSDTAMFVPEANYILDYKGRCCLLISGKVSSDNRPFDQFSVGSYGIEGKRGTFVDAEDGQLSSNPVEHGGVDSVIGFNLELEAMGQETVEYYVVAGDSQVAVEKIYDNIRLSGFSKRLDNTREYWQQWLSIAETKLNAVSPAYLETVKKSLLVIKAHVDKRGGIIASCDSSIYNYGRDYYSYVWPRDGAYAIWPLIRLGFYDEPKRFFEFCRDILNVDGYLMHKYQPDKAIGSTWHPLIHGRRKELAIQEDETAIVIFMLGEFYTYSKDKDFVFGLYDTLIKPACDFMSEFIDSTTNLPHASYDLWEQKFLSNTYTAALVHGALLAAADFAELFDKPDDKLKWSEAAQLIRDNFHKYYDADKKYLSKGILDQGAVDPGRDNTLDVSSLYAAFTFGDVPTWEGFINDTAVAIEDKLLDKSPSGGAPRYLKDDYFASEPAYEGNPWFVTTLWMAQYYMAIDDNDHAKELIDWAMSHTMLSGVFSEQVNPNDGSQVSVTPLVWSHAEFINTVLDFTRR